MTPTPAADRRAPWRGRASRGFLLVEALIASVILSVVLFSTLDHIVYGKRAIQDAVRRSAAMRAAQQKLEELRAKPYASVASVPRAPVPGRPGVEVAATVSPVTTNTSGFAYSFKRVEVMAYYRYGNRNREARLVMIRSP